uniref:Family with sequence similarity 184 member A n=1 Tax=Pipistrellus kuhlii TaxID=59472 RepID=A0A7J7YLH6_PIPKU|nr:family with sequence similarity 184 member A [Pipistrellus kuhlii]
MTADHLREKNIMRADFNKTNELLKEINAALQVSLEEMEEKYLIRESRPEDLQMITELRAMLTERDHVIKKLIEDNKFYQLELVNRETNFNKMFNSSPTVGVINPLAKVSVRCMCMSSRNMTAGVTIHIVACLVISPRHVLPRVKLPRWLLQTPSARSGLPGTSHSEGIGLAPLCVDCS